MSISNDHVVAIHYTLRDDAGEILDQSEPSDPLYYLHGHENIVPGLENALTGAKVGDKKQVVVPAKDGYGEREDELVLNVPRDQLPPDIEPEVGMELDMESDEGFAMPVRIVEVSDTIVVLDANHELAGETLHFDVEVVSIRAASAEELEHGHVHGPGGHHHH